MDRYQQKLSAYRDVSTGKTIPTSDTGADLIAAVVSYSIFIQRIAISVLTPGSTKELVIEDNSGTPIIVVDLISASVVEGQFINYDFGPDGFQLPEGNKLKYTNSGMAVTLQVQAYQKAIGVANPIIGNTVGGGTPGTLHS